MAYSNKFADFALPIAVNQINSALLYLLPVVITPWMHLSDCILSVLVRQDTELQYPLARGSASGVLTSCSGTAVLHEKGSDAFCHIPSEH